ncbi:MAG: hypothetical protein WCT77_05995 [Bacteroidota bacterium]|jgi:hypothetical protein
MKNIYFDFVNSLLNNFTTYENEPDINEHGIQLTKIKINEDYAKKWNVSLSDFVVLTKNGELLKPTLYRVGGMGTDKIKGKKYFMLLKYVEAFYDKKITDISGTKDPKHLEGRWCIIDEFGAEKAEFLSHKTPYLISESCIYNIDSNYYNIETKELYCRSYHKLESNQYIFLENAYDEIKEKRGVMRIDKISGEYKLYK